MTPAGPNSAMRERRHLPATQLNPAPKTASRRSAPYLVSSHDPESHMTKTEISPRLPDPHACYPAQPRTTVSLHDPESRVRKTEIPRRLPFHVPCPRPPQASHQAVSIYDPESHATKTGTLSRLPGQAPLHDPNLCIDVSSRDSKAHSPKTEIPPRHDSPPPPRPGRGPHSVLKQPPASPRPSVSNNDPESHTTKTETPPRRPRISG